MGNDFHFILAGRSALISPFLNYIQGEVSQALKRLLPKKCQTKLWADRHHEQVLLSSQALIDKVA